MASDRMKQAIDALERAIDRLEQNMDRLGPSVSPSPSSSVDAAAARAALKSLDALIGELTEGAHG